LLGLHPLELRLLLRHLLLHLCHLRVLVVCRVLGVSGGLLLRVLLRVLLVLMVPNCARGPRHYGSSGGKPDGAARNTSSSCNHWILLISVDRLVNRLDDLEIFLNHVRQQQAIQYHFAFGLDDSFSQTICPNVFKHQQRRSRVIVEQRANIVDVCIGQETRDFCIQRVKNVQVLDSQLVHFQRSNFTFAILFDRDGINNPNRSGIHQIYQRGENLAFVFSALRLDYED
jgi:hypothetical protein